MKYGTLVRIPESDDLAAVAREKFAALTAMGMDACQLVYKPAVYKMEDADIIRAAADAAGIEIIPLVWSVGSGGHDPAYAAALPCTGMKFTVKGGKAVFAGGGAGDFANPGFDEPTEKPNRAPGWEWTDKPGAVSFIDTDVKASGTASLRMEKYGANDHGHGRACHLLKVGDAGRYKVSCKIKTESVDPTSGLMMQVYAMDGRRVSAQRPNLPATQDWTTVECMFDSAGEGEFRVYAGIWGGKAGRFWIDDFKVEDMGCAPPLLREGLPFTVRDAKTGAELRAGVDYTTYRFSLSELGGQAPPGQWNTSVFLPASAVTFHSCSALQNGDRNASIRISISPGIGIA